MAGVSMKDIKLRIKSMESTKQITKAMEMVAASKLRKAQNRAIASRPYFETLYSTFTDIAGNIQDFSSPYTQKRDVKKSCYIVIAGDRGLAGGYNSNILKMVYAQMEGKDVCVLPIGKKAVEFFRLRKVPIVSEAYAEAADITIGDCFTMAKLLSKEFLKGEFDELILGYTNFVSMLSQTPATLPMLPLDSIGKSKKNNQIGLLTTYEPDPVSVFNAIIPEYLGGVIYGALAESVASEQAARRTAMDSATKNADQMIADLSLKFNRARQGAITQEITEIVAGSDQ
ncbi:MAG: ATP synthase F1 subunit gamma [Clostridia bacterium]|nr:ATP synthase F1 subunit gamma [Clostridia bacterium]